MKQPGSRTSWLWETENLYGLLLKAVHMKVSKMILHAREKARKQARQEAAQKAQGQQGGELTGSQVEGASAACPVCWGECSHR